MKKKAEPKKTAAKKQAGAKKSAAKKPAAKKKGPASRITPVNLKSSKKKPKGEAADVEGQSAMEIPESGRCIAWACAAVRG